MTIKDKREFAFWAVLVLIVSILLVWICARSLLISNISPGDEFCTIDDEVYQAISLHAEEWLRKMEAEEFVNLIISVPSGKKYSVSITSYPIYREFLIVLKHGWNERLGFWGYLYSSIGEPDLTDKYVLRHLEGGVYCYQRKRGYMDTAR
jgi:hypothetical protein